MFNFGKRFMSTGQQLQYYIDQANSKPLYEAFGKNSQLKQVDYGLGVALRPTNVAASLVLAHGGYNERLSAATKANPDGHMMTVWGTKSELVNNTLALDMCQGLAEEYGALRIGHLIMNGMYHVGPDDIDLHAAIIMEGQRVPTDKTAAYS